MNGSGFSLSARQRDYELERAADGAAAQALAGTHRWKGAQAETVINGSISREFLWDSALLPLADDTSRPRSGIVCSLSLFQQAAWPERRFGITTGKADLLPETFTSATAIWACPRARERGNQEAAHG